MKVNLTRFSKATLLASIFIPFSIAFGGGITISPILSLLLANNEQLFKPVIETEEVTDSKGNTVKVAKNELLIYLHDDITDEQYTHIKSRLSELKCNILILNEELGVIQTRVRDDADENYLINEIEKLDGVYSVRFNRIHENIINFILPGDNDGGYQAYIYNNRPVINSLVEQKTFFPKASFGHDYWVEHIKLDEALAFFNALTSKDKNIKIGVADSGMSKDQTVVAESRLKRINSQGNISDDDTTSVSSHGIEVTAFSSGTLNGVNTYNDVIHGDIYSFDDRTWPCKNRLKWVTTDALLVLYALSREVDIINISSGPGGGEYQNDCLKTGWTLWSEDRRRTAQQSFRQEVMPALRYGARRGVFFVFSAGNDHLKDDNKLLAQSDDPYATLWQSNALRVAASGSDYKDAAFSTMGDVVEIAAPGKEVSWGDGNPHDGTSFSAPIVTGAAGLIKSINPTLSPPELKHILIANADSSLQFSAEAIAAGTNSPKKILNIEASLKSALLTKDISKEVHGSINLNKNVSKTVEIQVTVPEQTISGLDILFLIDVSGSYGDDIDTLQSQADSIIDNIESKGIDTAYGVAAFSDFPISPYGGESEGDKAFFRLQPITSDIPSVKTAIDKLDNPLHFGNDGPEAQLEALFQSATGAGRDINKNGNYTDTGDLPPLSVGWREGALKVILFATDATFHDADSETNYPGAGKIATIEALQDKNIIVYGLQSGSSSSVLAEIESITSVTNGSVFQLSHDSSLIADAIASAVDEFLSKTDIELSIFAGQEWISNVVPSIYEDILPDQTVSFSLELMGIKQSGMNSLDYQIELWAIGNGGVVLGRYKIPIHVE